MTTATREPAADPAVAGVACAARTDQRVAGGWFQLTSSRPRLTRWSRGAAVVVFAGMAVGAWWPVLGHTLLAAAPAVAVAGALAAGRGRPRIGAVALVVWIPLALLLAGLPIDVIKPARWASSATALSEGWRTVGLANRRTTATDQWAVASALLAFGASWLMAGLVATQKGRVASGLAYLLSAVPFVAAAAIGGATDTAWHGAALLAATILWMTRGRAVLAVTGAAAIGAVALVGAGSLGPEHRWLSFGGDQRAAFTQLETQQTYGPLENRRTGATMLEVTASQPALWRMQVFDSFDGSGFQIARFGVGTLPQPKARSVTTKVKVVGLKNRLVVSAGQVTSVKAAGSHRQVVGEGTELTPGPVKGSTYAVQSEVVDATTAQLAKVAIPSGSEYDPYTRIYAPPPSPIARAADGGFYGFGRFGRRRGFLPGSYQGTPLASVQAISRTLAGGSTTELAVVKRVEAYLKDPSRFAYTTDVGDVSDAPIADFLLTTHRGYCQHFAGAAALLLRLAGIPARVVAGFATGEASGTNTYKVTDDDAHAWIEVYFPGYGWVPFNPTPSVAAAVVPTSLDRFAPPASRLSSVGGAALPGVLVVLLAAAGGGWWMLRRRRRLVTGAPAAAQLGDLLARIIPGPVEPGATLTRLQPRLAAIGPAVAGLAARTERERFAAGSAEVGSVVGKAVTRPRLELWRALRRDVGALRATVLLVRRR